MNDNTGNLFNGWGYNHGFTASSVEGAEKIFFVRSLNLESLNRKINGRACVIKDTFGRIVETRQGN